MINGLFIDDRGTKRYYLDGQLHRNDGPAVEYPDGSQFYWQHNKLHREDGPAYKHISKNTQGNKTTSLRWFFRGKQIMCKTQAEFERLLKLQILWE